MTEPKFSVGDRVQVVRSGAVEIDDTMVVNSYTHDDFPGRFFYHVAATRDDHLYDETMLRRRPDPGTDWETLREELTQSKPIKRDESLKVKRLGAPVSADECYLRTLCGPPDLRRVTA